jgi:hypothetical protein
LREALYPAMAIVETAARKLLHGATIAQGAADVGGVSFGLWDLVTGLFSNIRAYLFAAVAGAAHLLVLPLEKLWQWLVTVAAAAAGAITSGIDGLWQHVSGFFAGIFAALASAPHLLVLPLEKLWQWLVTAAADAAGAVSSGLGVLWHLVEGFFPGILAAVTSAAHELPKKLEELSRWLQAAAAVALPFVLGAAAVLLLLALIWYCGSALCTVTVGVCRSLVSAVCYLGHGLYFVALAVHQVLASFLPQCMYCVTVVTMRAPGAAGMLISRAAFQAAPALYFQILRAAGPVVAAAVFSSKAVVLLVAAPVAALFGASVSA